MKYAVKFLVLCFVFISAPLYASEDALLVADPFESVNRKIFTFNDALDRNILVPIATKYTEVIPQPARTGISNFFSNLRSPMIILNDLLQLKFRDAAMDTVRFGFNTTLGFGGLIDFSTYAGIERHDEDFGQTLGFYGVGEGFYLVIPFLGPSTGRDLIGTVVDTYSDPVYYMQEDRDRIGVSILRGIDTRARLLGASKVLQVGALDEYEFVRDAFVQRRINQIYDGNPPEPDFYDDSDEEME